MKHLLLASLITLLAFSTACGQASEPEPVASDGIQVHGHWTVTVTNPDGTLDAVHEFDNDFVNIGLLPNLLSGKNRIDGSYFRLLVTSNEKLSCLEQDGTTLNNGIYLESQINVEESYGLPFSISATCTVLTTPTTPPEQSQAIEWIYTDFRDHSNCFDKWDPIQEKKFLVAAKRWQMNRFQSRLCSSIILPRH